MCIELLSDISSTALQLVSGKDFEGVLPSLEMQHAKDSE
jgi:hypothetical protein